MKWTAAGLVVALALAGLAGWQWRVAVQSRELANQQTNIAVANELAGDAISMVDTAYDRSLLLALAALDVKPTFKAKSALYRALLANPHLEKYLRGHTGAQTGAIQQRRTNGLAISHDDHLIASVGEKLGHRVSLWSLGTGRLTEFEDPGVTIGVAISPNNELLASLTEDGDVTVRDITNAAKIAQWRAGHKGDIGFFATSITFSPDGLILATGGESDIRLWDPRTGTLRRSPIALLPVKNNLQQQKASTPMVDHFEFLPDGAHILADGDIYDLNTATWSRGKHDGFASLDGKYFAFVSCDEKPDHTCEETHQIVLTNLQTPSAVEEHIDTKNDVGNLIFSNDDSLLAATELDHGVEIWDLQTHKNVGVLRDPSTFIDVAAFFQDRTKLITLGIDGSLTVWRIQISQRLLKKQISTNINEGQKYRNSVDKIAINSNADLIFTGSVDDKLLLFGSDGKPFLDLSNQDIIKNDLGHSEQIFSYDLSADGTHLALIDAQNRVVMIDIKAKQAQPVDTPPIGLLSAVAVAPDGKKVAAGSRDGRIFVYDVDHQTSERTIGLGKIEIICFSGDSQHIAFADDKSNVFIWDPGQRGATELPKPHQLDIMNLALNRSGSLLAAGATEGYAIWSLPDYTLIKSFQTGGGPGFPFSVRLAGVYLFTGQPGGPMAIEDASGREPLGPPLSLKSSDWQNDFLGGMAIDQDGKMAAFSTFNGDVLIWDMELQSWKDKACSIANRNLTAGEWEQYLGTRPYRKVCPQLRDSD